jgi:glycosyltransferase involved in cell wall biosynthesis
MPTVSIIMPTYNRAWIIERAVRSVLQQTLEDWELIVVDDGSTDDTLSVLHQIFDPRLRVEQIAHRGQAAARNHGMAVADSPLIAYLDTDNVWQPQFLEVMTGELRERDVLAYCSQQLFLVEGTREEWRIVGRKVRSEPFNPARILTSSYIDTNAVLHRRDVLGAVGGGFDETLRSSVDWDLFGRIALRFPFAVKHVDQVLCDYYFFPPQITSSVTADRYGHDQVRAEFGLHQDTGEGLRIREKLEQLACEYTTRHLHAPEAST